VTEKKEVTFLVILRRYTSLWKEWVLQTGAIHKWWSWFQVSISDLPSFSLSCTIYYNSQIIFFHSSRREWI